MTACSEPGYSGGHTGFAFLRLRFLAQVPGTLYTSLVLLPGHRTPRLARVRGPFAAAGRSGREPHPDASSSSRRQQIIGASSYFTDNRCQFIFQVEKRTDTDGFRTPMDF